MSYSNSIISGVLSYIYYTLSNASSSVSVISLIIAIIAFIIMLMILVVLFVYLFGWLERKIIARIQSRHGPTYVGKFGLLQNFADVTKLLSKENIMPKNADMPLFNIIMPVTYALLLFTLFFIPISGSFVGINATISLLVVFTILSFSPLLLFLVAWTSGNKFASISAQRSVMVMISYEIPMLLVVVASAMLSRGFSLYNIVQTQSNVWFALIMPIGFIIFFIVMLAEMERPPFDVREADNELIAGWLTDISAPYYALALFTDYTRVFVGSLLISFHHWPDKETSITHIIDSLNPGGTFVIYESDRDKMGYLTRIFIGSHAMTKKEFKEISFNIRKKIRIRHKNSLIIAEIKKVP